uniref:Uncharacterized protein n=1 Tax=Rhizophora mucronata TaxID=61149 RepID=A0A2P2LRU4_RHIMU
MSVISSFDRNLVVPLLRSCLTSLLLRQTEGLSISP